MHTTAPEWFPLPTLPPLVAWTVEANGVYSAFAGPATAVAPLEAAAIPGQHYHEVTRELPEVREVVETVLSGRAVATMVPAWGRRWFVLARPEFGPRGVVLRAHGTALLLPEDAVSPAGDGNVESYLCTRPVRSGHLSFVPGDVLTLHGVEAGRMHFFPRSLADLTLRRHPDAFAPSRDEPEAPRPPSQPAASPALRVIP